MRRSALLVLAMCCAAPLWLAAPAMAFDRDAAVSWAEAHWNDTNDAQFPGYIDGEDCTNYASACLYLGGVRMDGDWYCYRTHLPTAYNRSYDWVNANGFRLHFWGKSGISEVGSGYNFYGYYGCAKPTSDIAMVRGDVVSINFDRNLDSVTDHTEFGIGRGTSALQPGGTGQTFYGDLIDQRNTNRRHAIWHCLDRYYKDQLKYWVFRVWHIDNGFTN